MSQEAILIVDDDPDVREMFVDMIKPRGYAYQTASNSIEALGLLCDHDFDIIISDIHMPGIDGLRLIHEVHKQVTDIPFIIITGFSEQYSYDKVIGAGANDFIKKPFSLNELETKLVRILSERELLRENQNLLERQVTTQTKLTNLLEVALDLTAELDFDRLFKLIISRVTRALGAERTSLYIIDWENKEIWTKVAEQVDKQIRLPIGEGISGRVAQTGEMINTDDVTKLDFFNPAFDVRHNFQTRSCVCMPIYNRNGERIAVIQVMNKAGRGRFGDEDINLLKSLAAQVEIALENSRLMEELSLSFESSIRTLSATVDARHPLTAGHSQRVTEYSLLIARQLGLDEKEKEVIKYAGLLHDIGKIGIRDDVLLKYGRFTDDEREEMNTHPLKTREILEKFRFPQALQDVAFVAAHHHERVNGEGYPDGLAGEKIPLAARILSVADVFDALTSQRDYPKYTQDEELNCEPMPLEKAISILQHDAGSYFDSRVVDAFLVCLPQALYTYRGTHFRPV
ncbi:HD domain-containing phosphohydrolase, partial [Thermodesulfobacteriota bacterium]